MTNFPRTMLKLLGTLGLILGLAAMLALASLWTLQLLSELTASPTLEQWWEQLPTWLSETVADVDRFTKWLGVSWGVTIASALLLGAIGGGLRVARRSLRQHALSTFVTVSSVALGVGLLLTVLSVQVQTQRTFEAATGNFDAVLGARGSQLQLVLNSIYHLENSPGNLPWSVYEEIAAHPAVERALPLAVGDNYRGFRVVGVDVRLFTEHELDEDGRRITVREGGRVFDPGRREAVIGSFAARQLGLSVGDVFNTYHGLSYNPRERHENDSFTVVGILDPTNTPMDRVLWIPLEGYFRMSGHVLQGAGQPYRPQAGTSIPDEHKEVSGVLLTLRQQGFSLSQQINRQGNVATLAWPVSRVIAELFERMGWLNRVLEIIAYLVVLVAAGSILASVYNTMNERRREFAILRALGARKRTVFGAIVIESAAIALLGTLLGYVIYLGLMTGTATILRTQVGVVLEVTQWHPGLLLTPIGMTIVGATAGILPAVKAYGTDVAANLIPQS